MDIDVVSGGQPAAAASSAMMAEPKAVSEVKKRAAVLDSTSDSGHASDGTDHGHLEGNAAGAAAGAGAVANKNRQVGCLLNSHTINFTIRIRTC